MCMSATLIRNETGTAKIGRAVILYDQLETMLAANQFVGRLPPHAFGCAEWTVNSWRFDLLEPRAECEAALDESSDADVMFLALGDTQALREWPEDWLVRWARRRQSADAVLGLVLIGAANRAEAGAWVIAPLLRLVDEAHLEFFVVDDAQTAAEWDTGFRRSDGILSDWPGIPVGRGSVNCPPALRQCAEFIQQPADLCSAAGRLRRDGPQSNMWVWLRRKTNQR